MEVVVHDRVTIKYQISLVSIFVQKLDEKAFIIIRTKNSFFVITAVEYVVIGFLVEIPFTSTHIRIFYLTKMNKGLTAGDFCWAGDGVGPRSDPKGCSRGQKNIQLYAFS
jgi:hypothetical protein